MSKDTTKEASAFDNIPERVKENVFVPQVPQIIHEDLPKREVIPAVYSIMCGADDNEFYSFDIPEINEDYVSFYSPFQKGVIKEEILDQPVEEFYNKALKTERLDFKMTDGILIKKYLKEQINWLSRNEDDARNVIKDKIILKYQQVVPAIMNKMQTLEAKQKQIIQQQQQRRPRVNNNDDDGLLEL